MKDYYLVCWTWKLNVTYNLQNWKKDNTVIVHPAYMYDKKALIHVSTHWNPLKLTYMPQLVHFA
jgi:hypothetical protein